MKILILSINFKNWVCDTLYREQQAFSKVFSDVIFYGPGFIYNNNRVSDIIREIYGSDSPDAIICYISEHQFKRLPEPVIQHFHIPESLQKFPVDLHKVNIPKILWINDFWHCSREEWRKIILAHDFSAIFSTYCPPFTHKETFDRYFDSDIQQRIPFYPLPRAIDPALFKDYQLPKEIDVTLLGALDKDFYPLRNYFHNTLKRQKHIRYFSQPHPGYTYFPPEEKSGNILTGENYAKTINRSLIFLSCTGKYKIPFIKLYEILASKTLLMCDRPMGAEKIGLIDGETYVEVDQINFLEKIRFYLNHPKKLQRIADNGYELFLRRHTVEKRALELMGFVKDVISNRCREIYDLPNTLSPSHRVLPSPLTPVKRIVSKVKNCLLRNPLAWKPSNINPWEKPSWTSCLDSGLVSEDIHILDLNLTFDFEDYKLFLLYGLNTDWSKFPPIITQHSEIIIYRGIYLRSLAQKFSAKTFCEVGTARGWQSMLWADYLVKNNIDDGVVFSCDIIASNVPRFRTPLTNLSQWTRDELFSLRSAASKIKFIHGDSAMLAKHIDKPLNIVFIDGEHSKTAVLNDFQQLKQHFSSKCIVVFDDCDPRFPGIEEAVSDIASCYNTPVTLISFWPSYYKIAILFMDSPSNQC